MAIHHVVPTLQPHKARQLVTLTLISRTDSLDVLQHMPNVLNHQPVKAPCVLLLLGEVLALGSLVRNPEPVVAQFDEVRHAADRLEEEVELARAFRDQGDERAAAKLALGITAAAAAARRETASSRVLTLFPDGFQRFMVFVSFTGLMA